MRTKQELRRIYADLTDGKLSQKEALEKIKTIKVRDHDRGSDALLLTPVWQPGAVEASRIDLTEAHLVLCEVASVDIEELAALLPLSECLSLQTERRESIAQRYSEYALACFERVRTVLQTKRDGKVLVQIVAADDPERMLFAGFSGLLKTATLENPQFIGQIILVPAHATTEDVAAHVQAERLRAADALIRYDNGARQVFGWQEIPANPERPPVAFQERGVYLITGGLGRLGLLFAKEILERTREGRVVLTGRSALTAEKQALLDGISATAGLVSYRQVDVGNLHEVTRLIAAIKNEHGQLNGIIHSAGMIADNFILKKSEAEFSEVLEPKVAGTVNLDHATRGMELEFFVLFSSIAAAVGNVGQADYATANGFLDHFAAYRNRQVAAGQRHGRTRSIDWPLWRDGGMRLDAASHELLRETTGMQPMQTATGLDAFYRSLALPYDRILVVEGEPVRMRRALLAGRPSQSDSSSVVSNAGVPEADAAGLVEKTQDYLRKECSELLKVPFHQIDPHAALEQYGIDSMLATRMTSQLERTFGALSKTLFFEYRTIGELSKYFVESHAARLATLFASGDGHRKTEAVAVRRETPARATRNPAAGRRSSRPSSPPPSPPDEPAGSDPIAIIGLSGRYPEAVDIDAYWENLREGKDCIIEVPPERWDWQAYFTEDRTKSGFHYSKWGGFIAGVDEFDPLFFNISPKEAKFIDPQERLFLQHAWMAVEDAGYTRATLQVPEAHDLPGQVGVYVGVMYTEYQLFGAEASVEGNRVGVAGSAASIANRVSYAFNLHGPSLTLDTMCSSSLTAIHIACQDLKAGRTSLAIAGGVNVSIHPNKYLVLSAGQFISGDGHCQSFGEGGNGYIPGEGVGVVVLKRLSEAKRDGDHIYGVIRGSALNHGGKTNGYTVPNPQAQTGAIRRALAESHTDARHVSYIEAHGTGTKLGDPIEIAALSKAFRHATQDTGFCLIGSAKSNIGHCESAAGMAGLTKVLLQMRHRQIVPSLHSAQLNPNIDFDNSPFIVNQSLRTWEQPVVDGRTLPRIAGISSFGAGGSNAHMIVEEYETPVQIPVTVADVVIVLSARTPEQLQQKVHDLLAFLRPRLSTIDLVTLAYTLQTGREAMDERLGFLVGSVEQLVEKLEAYDAGEQSVDAYQGQVKRDKQAVSLFSTDADFQRTLEKWIANGAIAKLVELWVKGLDLDWGKLYGEARPRRMSLPTYPFAKERYWVDVVATAPSAHTAASSVLHPLLHSNTSDLSQQSYSSTFRGDEWFLQDRRTLPAAALLEMARVAVQHAARTSGESCVELRGMVWGQPVVVGNSTEISIALSASDTNQIDFEIYSHDADREVVHCQGRAVSITRSTPTTLDLTQLKGRANELLVQLQVPNADTFADYVLHPALIDSALQAAVALTDREPRALGSVESLRILAPCADDMAAWVRRSPDGGIDIDLCDTAGNVCAEMRGVSWQAASADIVEPPAALAIARTPAPVRKEIVIAAPFERKRPASISLSSPSSHAAQQPSGSRAPIALSNAAVGAPASSDTAPVRLYDEGNGIFSIEIGASSKKVIAQLLQALDRVQQEPSLKVVTIGGFDRAFPRGGRDEANDAVEQRLVHAIVAFPQPVIAVLRGDAIGAAFLSAALCDFMVCNEDASYGYTDAERQLAPTAAEAMLFGERFGPILAQDFLYISNASTGKQLRAKGWTCPIMPAARVEATARELAATLATKSHDALRLLKQHLTRRLTGLVDGLTCVDESPANAAASSGAENVLVMNVASAETLLADLESRLDEIRQGSGYNAIVLAMEDPEFLPGDALVPQFQRLIGNTEIPVVAALTGNARGNAWLIAQLCDACVYSQQGVYSSAGIEQNAAALFAYRFGNDAATEILLTGGDYSGAELQRRIGVLLVAEHGDVLPTAVNVAKSLTTLPTVALSSWKQQTASVQVTIGDVPSDDTSESPVGPIALRSRVVTATAHPDGIIVVKMEDRDARNMFSDALVDGLTEIFAHIDQTPAYKVVILTGYDHFFATGGTKENLLAIQAGKARFTDSKVFQLPLDCKLPVIAAMQGHGIGAGWCLGMLADLVLLSEESRYVSPYMSYGFTPGAGATAILPEKIGHDLARESLLTAQPLTGSALKARGLRLPVLPRADIDRVAMALAQQIAQQPRHRSIALKQQLTAQVREPLEETYRLELAMHDQTFVGRPETLAQIQKNFHDDVEPAAVAPAQPRIEPAKRRAGGDALPAIIATLRTLLAGELLLKERDIDENAQFVDLGLDSVAGVAWIRKINETYRTSIEATKVYSYPTLAQLGRHVKEEAEKAGTLSSAAPSIEDAPPQPKAAAVRGAKELTSRRGRAASRFVATTAAAPGPSQPIAIVGMAGQFPQAKNVDDFWRNLAEGRNCITQIAPQRWDLNGYYQPGDPVAGKTYCQWLGALEEYDLFDPLFFNISPTEAENMDPQQRLFLQACWHSIENAGYDARGLSGSKCGVFVGVAAGDYHQGSRAHQLSAHGFTGSATSILAARISYFLNLQGPCVSIDTACSSSLVAIAQACDSLNSGGSDLALAGGVYVMGGPDLHIRSSQTGMLSAEGRCFTFDQRADGFVPGEGVGVVVLKRLADAQRDRDIIYGVVQGWGINQDGRTNGITAPNPESQTRLEQDVYDKYGIDPGNISLIEAHGTGTKLGDPIEVEGLKHAFAKYTQSTEYCALGSVKSNIGHCLTAAGIAGVIKILLALKHKQLPPTINFERLNEHIDLTNSPFYVNTRLQEWKAGGAVARQAAISSFGFSGTNAHIVIGEALPPAEAARPVTVVTEDAKMVVPLSARKPKQLQQRAADLLQWLRGETSADLTEIAYTLQVGREAMEERAGFLVSTVAELAEALEAYLAGKEDLANFHQGQVKRGKESINFIDDDLKETIVDKWIAQRKLSKLLDLWTKGLELDWTRLYGETKPRRIVLPEYPFAKERYWIDAPAQSTRGEAPAVAATVLHPLLHANTSDLTEHRYSSTFTGHESFLTAEKGFPGAAYLEMARAAVEHAWTTRPESAALELHDVAWGQPAAVHESTRISIALAANEDGVEFEVYGQEGERETVHCQGRAVWSDEPARRKLDIAQLRSATRQTANEWLEELRFPVGDDAYVLQPNVIDGAFQAAIRLLGHPAPCLASSLATLRILSPCTGEMLAWVRDRGGRVDVDLIDRDGNVCVEMEGLELSPIEVSEPEPSPASHSYLCTWESQPELKQQPPVAHQNVVIVRCAPFSELDTTIREVHQERGGRSVLIHMGETSERIAGDEWSCGVHDPRGFETCLQGTGPIDAVYFLAMGEQAADPNSCEAFATSRERNEIQFLRLVQSLRQSDKAAAKVDLFVVTLDSHSSGHNAFLGAGVAGLGHSLAQSNSRYRIRNLDLSIEDLRNEDDRRAAFAAIAAEPPSTRGEACRLRSGRRARQTFFEVKWDAASPSAIRRGGAVLIAGGAGTVGRILTRNLIETHDATVVWIGRSAESSEKVQAALQSLDGLGTRPLYIEGDVTDLQSMQAALRQVKAKGLAINAAIFSAMAVSTDASIEEIAVTEFRNLFDTKAQGSWAFYTALKDEPLDFLCYFSSRQAYAFLGASTYSAYASGVTFSDAFVRSLQNAAPFPVGIINWGIWQSTIEEAAGGTATDGLDMLSDREGFDCFERFVSELRRGRVHQCLCVGESRLLESLMNRGEEVITLAPGLVPTAVLSVDDIAVPAEKIAGVRASRVWNELEQWFLELLFCQVGVLLKGEIIDKYLPWWSESLQVLRQHGYLELHDGAIVESPASDACRIRDEWPSQKAKYSQDPQFGALAILVSDCLESLPDILQGRALATDVIFPNSSLEKVEGVYKNNPLSDSFNEIVANTVVAYLERRLQSDPSARVRILEIGAGTGGTSAGLFAALRPFQASVEEYCYTDLSKAFFFHVEQNYLPHAPYIRCQRLDIEQPVEAQGFALASHDLVIAANVLHATKNIRQTIRNAKALLCPGGLLVLDEISRKSLYAHLTFGLLDGWWLFEDADLRIPNCPALLPSTWQQVLEEEGFAPVQFPATQAHDLGYQIVVAQSDGVIRQSRGVAEVRKLEAAPAPVEVPPAAVIPSGNAAEHVRSSILDCMCEVLKIAAGDIDADIAFSDYGIDSILGGKFIEQVNGRLGIRLNTAVIFEYPSLARLSKHVLEAHRNQFERRTPEPVSGGNVAETKHVAPLAKVVRTRATMLSRRRPVSQQKSKRDLAEPEARSTDIAVIGMSGMFPKAANVDEFWKNLADGVDAVEELPARYLDQRTAYSPKKQSGKTRCKWGGVLEERDCFDPLFFNISPKEAEAMNPHQRLVLQEGWKAIEDAGYNPKLLSGTQTGIFIGAEPTMYAAETFTGYSDAIVASRLSYVLNLSGPAFAVNTGCSSSAVAIHLACESLRNRETDLALAGGVNACMSQRAQISLDEIEMLSPSGRSRTFDSAADGTILSEGVAVVVLKRLDDAVRAGDSIYGVISASGINQDGASNGITAPSGAAQEQLIARVYEKYGIDPENISYVEAHGTGTKLGDPVEGNALVRAFRKFTDKTGYCGVGSAKSHIGHAAAAAGATGLIKILLSMQHSRIPRLLHFQALNPLIEFDGSPFYVAADESAWSAREGSPRMAALNAFGHSGTNAHLVVRDVPEPVADRAVASGPFIVPLSARTAERLHQKAIDLLAFIHADEPMRREKTIDLRSMAYTLQSGREAMEERLGFIVSSVEQLAGKLQSFIDGKQNIDGVRQGRTGRQKDAVAALFAGDALQQTVEQWIRDERLSKLLELWIQGVELDWEKFYDGARPRRMRLPVYPFVKERYWAGDTAPAHRPDLTVLLGGFESVENVIDQIDQGLIDEYEGVNALRLLVS